MIIGKLNYLETTEEVKVNLQKSYENMPDVLKLDSLNDAIADLESKRDELHNKIYRQK